MVRAVSLAVAAACSSPARPEPIGNHASAPNCRAGHFTGVVHDRTTNDFAIGATIVLGGGTGEDVQITDEHGQFDVPITAPRNKITIYYNDNEVSQMRTLVPYQCYPPAELEWRSK